ncbi:hypothetical protein Tco_1375730, partial [Tanacetum coccineum]
ANGFVNMSLSNTTFGFSGGCSSTLSFIIEEFVSLVIGVVGEGASCSIVVEEIALAIS